MKTTLEVTLRPFPLVETVTADLYYSNSAPHSVGGMLPPPCLPPYPGAPQPAYAPTQGNTQVVLATKKLTPEQMDKLCDQFRDEMFKAAGLQQPPRAAERG